MGIWLGTGIILVMLTAIASIPTSHADSGYRADMSGLGSDSDFDEVAPAAGPMQTIRTDRSDECLLYDYAGECAVRPPGFVGNGFGFEDKYAAFCGSGTFELAADQPVVGYRYVGHFNFSGCPSYDEILGFPDYEPAPYRSYCGTIADGVTCAGGSLGGSELGRFDSMLSPSEMPEHFFQTNNVIMGVPGAAIQYQWLLVKAHP